jgi:hypothetical protein
MLMADNYVASCKFNGNGKEKFKTRTELSFSHVDLNFKN